MAYREVSRVEIAEVVRRWQSGMSQRQIATGTGLSRATVRRYIDAAVEAGLARDAPAPSEEQLTRLAGLSLAGPRRVETPTGCSTRRGLGGGAGLRVHGIHSGEDGRGSRRDMDDPRRKDEVGARASHPLESSSRGCVAESLRSQRRLPRRAHLPEQSGRRHNLQRRAASTHRSALPGHDRAPVEKHPPRLGSRTDRLPCRDSRTRARALGRERDHQGVSPHGLLREAPGAHERLGGLFEQRTIRAGIVPLNNIRTVEDYLP